MNLTNLRQITESELPSLLNVLSGRASGGFPSPAADHYEPPISLDELVELRAPHVWLGETEGDSMAPAGILNCTRLISAGQDQWEVWEEHPALREDAVECRMGNEAGDDESELHDLNQPPDEVSGSVIGSGFPGNAIQA